MVLLNTYSVKLIHNVTQTSVIFIKHTFSTDSKQSYAVYRFIISINPSDITELDAVLGNYILHNPIQAAQIFQSVSMYI